MAGVLLTVAYDGTEFSGWAPQPGERTIAGELLAAIRTMDPTVAEVRGASRTDAGVHANGQRAAFDTSRDIPPRGWALGLASALPPSIAIRAASHVAAGFQPRFQNRGKRYSYRLLVDPLRDPLVERFALRIPPPFDRARAEGELAAVVGTHDFAAFRGSADARDVTTRTIRTFRLDEDPTDRRLLRIVVEGDGFLYNMVRILVGTLVDVATGRLDPGAFARALASKDRRDLGKTAPPHGLVLEEVLLGDEGAGRFPPS